MSLDENENFQSSMKIIKGLSFRKAQIIINKELNLKK